jgi:hypothetical protein
LKKVLIISYFFPPCNLTASQRALSWAKYLHQFGYFPLIITRKWETHLSKLQDMSFGTSDGVLHEKNDDYEVYYLPYKPNFRDKIFISFGEKKWSVLRRALTFLELLFQPFFTAAIPYSNLFDFSKAIAKKENMGLAVITGNPFNLFKLGYELHKELGIKWIADYRDAWTTTEILEPNQSFFHKVLFPLEKWCEQKWVSSASKITASSMPIAAGINALTGVNATALYNGYNPEDFDFEKKPKYETFTIAYIGTLYSGQKIEIFCEAYKEFIDSSLNPKAILLFPGLAFYPDQAERIMNCLNGYSAYYEISPRIERSKILEIETRAHLLLHVAWDEHKGIIASKIYEYIGSGTPILVTPGDQSSIDEIMEQTTCGVCTYSAHETKAVLNEAYELFEKRIVKTNDVHQERLYKFSRLGQVKELAKLLDDIS